MENKNQTIINLEDFKGKEINKLFRFIQKKIHSIEIVYSLPSINGNERFETTNLYGDSISLSHHFDDKEIKDIRIKN